MGTFHLTTPFWIEFLAFSSGESNKKRSTLRGIPKLSKISNRNFRSIWFSSSNFRLKRLNFRRFDNFRILRKTFPGSYRAICPRLKRSGIFGWTKSARCFLKNLSYYVLKTHLAIPDLCLSRKLFTTRKSARLNRTIPTEGLSSNRFWFSNWRSYGVEDVYEFSRQTTETKH